MIRMKSLVAAAAVAVASLSAIPAAQADQYGDLVISGAWSRASAGMAKAGAAFFMILNEGKVDDRIVSASADVSDKVELHTHLNENGVMKMRQVPHIDVVAGGNTELKPGSFHIMLIGLKAPLKVGTSFPLTVKFAKAGDVVLNVEVKAAGAMGMGNMNHGKMNMDHGKMGGMNDKMPANSGAMGDGHGHSHGK